MEWQAQFVGWFMEVQKIMLREWGIDRCKVEFFFKVGDPGGDSVGVGKLLYFLDPGNG